MDQSTGDQLMGLVGVIARLRACVLLLVQFAGKNLLFATLLKYYCSNTTIPNTIGPIEWQIVNSHVV